MRVFSFCMLFLFQFMLGNVFAGEVKEIRLNDGSVLYGEVLSLDSNTYTIKTISLGTLNVGESEIHLIKSIRSSKEEIQTLQQQMVNNEDLFQMILGLQNDPDFQKVLNDPAIIEAVNAGNMDALLSNPKFMKLLNNPRILEIRNRLEE